MAKSNYITITKGNIHLVAFRIKQFIERMETIGMRSFYLDTMKNAKIFGKGNFDVLQSQKNYLSKYDYNLEVDTMRGNTFIRINYQMNCSGILLRVGEKIRITSSHIYTRRPRIHHKIGRAYPLEVWSKGDPNICANQTWVNKRQSDDYWREVEAEWDREETDEQFDEARERFNETLTNLND